MAAAATTAIAATMSRARGTGTDEIVTPSAGSAI
jgi:hypothetical protein